MAMKDKLLALIEQVDKEIRDEQVWIDRWDRISEDKKRSKSERATATKSFGYAVGKRDGMQKVVKELKRIYNS
jgi:hypothetical protein